MEFDIDLDLIFENFVRDYRSFGLNQDCNWSRHTTEYISWFANEGLRKGYHVDQEIRYDEPPQIGEQIYRYADLVWVTNPDFETKDEVFMLHLESETGEDWAELTVDLVTYSPFKPLPMAICLVHRTKKKKSQKEFASDLVKYAINRCKGRARTLLLMMDLVWNDGDPFYGVVIDGKGLSSTKMASGVLHDWRGGTYYDLKLEKQVDEIL